jgi:SM-20-related protein
LRAHALQLDADARLHAAAVGRAAVAPSTPRYAGIASPGSNTSAASAAEQRVRLALEELRLVMNRRLALGLFEFEAHYALYPPGAGYARASRSLSR